MDIKLSNIVRSLRDFIVDNDERTLFDWLVYAQRSFGSHKPFRHSITQVARETRISRHLQNRIFKHFVELGFLEMGREKYDQVEYRSFYVNFTILAEGRALGGLMLIDTETFKEYREMFTEWAKEQTTGEKPLSKYKQKEKELEEKQLAERVTALMTLLNNRYNKERIRYNKGELTKTKPRMGKSATGLVFGKKEKKLLGVAGKMYSDIELDNAMTAYSHAFFKGEIKPAKIIPYFLTIEEDEFVLIKHFLDEFNSNYSFINR